LIEQKMPKNPPRVNFNPADFEPVRQIALKFPGAEDSISHEGTPSIKVRGKLLCRLHESGEFLSIQTGFERREYYLETYPEAFHLPEHFKAYPYIALWLHAARKPLLEEVLEQGWRRLASKKQLKEWDEK
jgi:hypothetical protein